MSLPNKGLPASDKGGHCSSWAWLMVEGEVGSQERRGKTYGAKGEEQGGMLLACSLRRHLQQRLGSPRPRTLPICRSCGLRPQLSAAESQGRFCTTSTTSPRDERRRGKREGRTQEERKKQVAGFAGQIFIGADVQPPVSTFKEGTLQYKVAIINHRTRYFAVGGLPSHFT